jgi:hypothetical protein
MKLTAKELLAQQKEVNIGEEETLREPATEQLTDEEIEHMLEEEQEYETGERRTSIEHAYLTYGEPDRMRFISDDGKLWDVLPMPDGTVAVEPITVKLVYNPQLMKKYDNWEDAQKAMDKVCPGCSPFKAINAKLMKKLLANMVDEKRRINPYEVSAQYEEEEVPEEVGTEEPASVDDFSVLGERIGIQWDEVEFSPDDLKKGYKVELEHGTKNSQTNVTDDDPEATAKIALAHLKESPRYYEFLEQMEKKF